MKKSSFFGISALTLLNVVLLGLLIESTIKLLGLLGYIAIFLKFTLVCCAFFIIALLGIIAVAIVNYKLNNKWHLTKRTWHVQYILSVILAIPTMYAWEILFDYIYFCFYQI